MPQKILPAPRLKLSYIVIKENIFILLQYHSLIPTVLVKQNPSKRPVLKPLDIASLNNKIISLLLINHHLRRRISSNYNNPNVTLYSPDETQFQIASCLLQQASDATHP